MRPPIPLPYASPAHGTYAKPDLPLLLGFAARVALDVAALCVLTVIILTVRSCIQSSARAALARIAIAHTDYTILGDTLNKFKADCGRYPTTAEGFQALINPPMGMKNWRAPYSDRCEDRWSTSLFEVKTETRKSLYGT